MGDQQREPATMSDEPRALDAAAATWSDQWFAAAAETSSEVRRGWIVALQTDAPALAELDSLSRAALAVACEDVLDLADSTVVQLVADLVLSAPPDSSRGDRLMRRLLTRELDRDVSRRMRMRLAIGASVRDEPEAACAWFADLLDETRGEGSEFEVRVLVNWSTTLINHGRLLEAMVCLRRAEEVLGGIESPRALGYVLLKRAEVFKQLEHRTGETELYERVDRLLADHELTDVRHLRLRQGVYSHIERGEFDQAGRMLDHLAHEGDGSIGRRLFEITRTMAEVDIALGRGDLDRARAQVERLETEFAEFAHVEIVVTEQRQQLHEAAGDVEALRQEAAVALDLLEGAARRGDGWSYVMTRASRTYRRLRGVGPESLERRAADLAATASLERIREVDRLMQAESGYAELHAEDRALLGAFRMRFLTANRELCRLVAERIARSSDGLARWARERVIGADGLTVVCAWCQQVSSDQGHWLPLGHLVSESDDIRATHGACPGCVADMLAGLEARGG